MDEHLNLWRGLVRRKGLSAMGPGLDQELHNYQMSKRYFRAYAARDSNPRPRSKSPVLMPSQLAAHTVRSPAWNRTKIVRVTTACSAVELRGNGIVRAPGRT